MLDAELAEIVTNLRVLGTKNPGGLFGPVTVDSLGEEGISSARNATSSSS
jgi:hypothetical protein